MKFIYTEHAIDVIHERKISEKFIERTISDPDLTTHDRADVSLIHYLKKIPEHENRVLRVVMNIINEPNKIVTVYFDRTMRGRI
jgi:hypothetical protein